MSSVGMLIQVNFSNLKLKSIWEYKGVFGSETEPSTKIANEQKPLTIFRKISAPEARPVPGYASGNTF